MRRALVTGASGQDGSYLVEQLIGEDVDVHALALAGETVTGHATVHHGDISDVEGTRRLALELGPHEIYNLAAVSSVARSWDEPDLTARVNGVAAVGLLESALQVQERHGHDVRFVQPSSAEIFGVPDHTPQTESTLVRPVNPYGAAKAFAHLMVEVYRRRGLHAVSLVLYNHESPRRPRQFVTRRITSGVAAIVAGRTDRLTLGNLTATRDWGWAPDYVRAMTLAARSPQPRDYVVATGESHSVAEFVESAFGAAGVTDWRPYVEVDPDLLRPVDAASLTGDASALRRDLGWAPTVAFREMVDRMVQADLAATRP